MDLRTVGDLTIEIVDREELRIEGEDNLLTFLEIEVVDGVLEIRQREGVVLSPTKPVRYRVAVRELNRGPHAAGGKVRIPPLGTERLHVQHRGSGRLEGATLETGLLSIYLLPERLGRRGVPARHDSASATLYVEGQLDATVPGKGDVHYRGNPNVNLSTTGAGRVGKILS